MGMTAKLTLSVTMNSEGTEHDDNSVMTQTTFGQIQK